MIWVVVWLALGVWAAWAEMYRVVQQTGKIELNDAVMAFFMVLMGPISWVAYGFYAWLTWLDDHQPVVLYRKKKEDA